MPIVFLDTIGNLQLITRRKKMDRILSLIRSSFARFNKSLSDGLGNQFYCLNQQITISNLGSSAEIQFTTPSDNVFVNQISVECYSSAEGMIHETHAKRDKICLLYTSPSPRDS